MSTDKPKGEMVPIVFDLTAPEYSPLNGRLQEALRLAPNATRVFAHVIPLKEDGKLDWQNSHLVDMRAQGGTYVFYMPINHNRVQCKIGIFCPLFETLWSEPWIRQVNEDEPTADVRHARERTLELVSTPQWSVTQATVQGTQHIRDGLPNQDAILVKKFNGGQIVAVSDGHGSESHPRSDRGAQFAVEVAVAEIENFLTHHSGEENLKTLEAEIKAKVVPAIIKKWGNSVAEDLRVRPLTEKDLIKLRKKPGGESKITMVLCNPAIAYGATILCLATTEKFTIFLQLGDGDILTVDHNKEVNVVFPPIPGDKQIGNATYSLTSRDAKEKTRVSVLPHNPYLRLTLLSTDGLSNSFEDRAFKFAADCLDSGQDDLDENLAGYLADIAKEGSGDDITVGMVWQKAPSLFSNNTQTRHQEEI